MKKKHLLLILLMALLAPWAAKAQGTLFSEDFEGGSMPTGWTTDGPGSWSVGIGDYSSGTGAGHGSYNAKITHSTSSSVTKLITPEIDLSSATSAELSFMHVQRSWSGDIDQLRVYYRTSSSGAWTLLDGQTYTGAVASWTTEENIALPNISSTYQIAFEMTDKYGYGVGIDYVQIVQGASCVKPTGLAATLTPGDGTIATLSWTKGGEETDWVLEYGTTSDFTGATSVNVSGTPTKNLTGLTAETKYYARVKADCGGGDESDWSTTCSFQPTPKTVIGSGDATNSYLPSYTYYKQALTQQIYTAAELGTAGYIESIDFYCTEYATTRNMDIYMVNTDQPSFLIVSDWITVTAGDMVFSGEVDYTNGAWTTITLDAGFNYDGNHNVAIIIDDNTGSYDDDPASFRVFNATDQAIYVYNDDTNYDPTNPGGYTGSKLSVKNQIRILKGEAPSCFPPIGLTIGEVTNHTAALSWTPAGEQTAWHVYYSESDVAPADDIALNKVIEVETNPAHTLTGLDAETTYYVWVRGNCGTDDYSAWVGPQSFTTEVACAAPTALIVSDIASSTATLNWTSSAENFNIRYSVLPNDVTEHKYDDGTYSTSVNAGGDPFFWGIMFPANTFTDNHIRKISVYDANPNNSGFLFICDGSATEPESVLHRSDVALTGSAEFVDIAVDITFDNTKAVWVLMYTPYAPGCAKTDDPNGRWVSLDGSTWQDITSYDIDNTWMLRAYVDDATEYSWTNKTSTTNTYNLTSLTPESDYIVEVQTNCGGIDGTSLWLGDFFTTLSNCPIPTDIEAGDLTQNTAKITWTGSTDVDSYTIQYSASTHTGDIVFSEGFESGIGSWVLVNCHASTGISTNAKHTGDKGFLFNYNTTPPQYLVSPELTGITEDMLLEFWYKNYSSTYPETFCIGTATTTGATAEEIETAFTFGDETTASDTQWHQYTTTIPTGTKYICFKYTANDKYYLYIDDITIGKIVPATPWTTPAGGDNITAENFTLTGLTADTKYDVRVASNCNMTYCEPISFTTLAEHNIVFPEDGTWSAGNFEPTGAPGIDDDVIIRADVNIPDGTNAQANNINLENGAVITVANGATLTINGNVTNGGATKLIVEDGGQLIVKKTGINATVKKSVTHAKGVDGWYTIASPINSNYTSATSVTNMIQVPADNYDLYYYLESSRLWKNYKASSFYIAKGKGYLYWNSTGAELAFPGSMNYGDVNVTLTKTAAEPADELAGFNLIGNPYPHNIYKGAGTAIENSKAEGYVLATGFYTLSNSGEWQAGTDNTTAIKPAQGILVQATTAGTLTIKDKTESAAKANNDNIKFSVANNQFEDVTYALFMDEIGLTKINHRNDQAPMIYIPQDGEDYAIATMGDDTETFGLNFKAMTTGMYTLSAKADGMYSYLHVIDRLTGEDIDMLVDGKYEFIGSPRDNEARFIVKLRYNANGFDNDEFIYQNGDELIVNGEGELQVYDVMGRYVASYNVNGNKRISAEQFSNAVYIFRLIGSDVKTQKIVVR